jgi:hypothetical protein
MIGSELDYVCAGKRGRADKCILETICDFSPGHRVHVSDYMTDYAYCDNAR